MSFDLDRTLSWTQALAAHQPQDAATLAMLNDLQGNILKGHGRPFTAHLFLAFEPYAQDRARTFLKQAGARVTTALDQLTGTQVFKSTGKDAGPFTALFLSADGYRAAGLEDALPEGAAFRAGMKARQAALADPLPAQWEPWFAGPLHAMVLLGAATQAQLAQCQADMEQLVAAFAPDIKLVRVEAGIARRNDDGQGIEHFGYVDGRSQPLVLQEDLQAEQAGGGIDQWNPAIPLGQLLVPCPGGELDVSMGSYFVFRKLEQNVQGFKARELALAEASGGIGELAGAAVVGRFENGTPVLLGDDELPVGPSPTAVPNNFNFDADAAGLKCPYAGHIRKANPRRDDTQQHLMARRGIPYGERGDDPDDGQIDNKPTQGVGLLFMAYQASLENQFEFTQRSWANNAGFDVQAPAQPVGIDPVIGQPPGASPQRFVKEWGVALGPRFDFSGFVTLKGGEYFFAPCVSFFALL